MVLLEAFCDASHGSEENRKSTSGYLIHVYGNLVYFKSKKQSIVALSTAESEYVAMSGCLREMLFIRNILIELRVFAGPAKLFGDNRACICKHCIVLAFLLCV